MKKLEEIKNKLSNKSKGLELNMEKVNIIYIKRK